MTRVKKFFRKNIALFVIISCLTLIQSCDFSSNYKPSKYSSQNLIDERRKRLQEYGKGNYDKDGYYIPPSNNLYNNGSYYYPYYEDNDSFYQNYNRYPSYDPSSDNDSYYYDNYDKKLPPMQFKKNSPNNLDRTFPIYFD